MVILGIESSCDETAVSIVEVVHRKSGPHVRILANVVSSQVKLHAKFGGVVPNLAKREHQRNFVPVLKTALKKASLMSSKFEYRNQKQIQNTKLEILKSILERESELFARIVQEVLPLKAPAIDSIAVTVGPGLAPALWVGVNFARALSFLWAKPIIPVNHLEGHIATNLLQEIRRSSKSELRNPRLRRGFGGQAKQIQNLKSKIKTPFKFRASDFKFPAIALLVSGGHTELVFMRRFDNYTILGETLDDAAGEAFDKVAKMMRLGFPGGPVISKLAESGNEKRFLFPRPMSNSPNFDFSFSGLKTSVLYKIRDLKKLNAKIKSDIAASFQSAVVDVLVAKTVRAARQYRVKTVMIGGGVAANKKLRHDLGVALKKLSPIPHILFPQVSLTGDNALMIALAGYFNRSYRVHWKTLEARPNLRLDD